MSPLATAQIFALITGIALAAGDVSVRLALRTSTPISGTFVQSVITLLIFGPVALATTSLESLKGAGLLILFISGVASPGLASTLYYMGFHRIGVSRSSTISASAPLVTVVIAAFALNERPTSWVYLGTLLIVAGVASLARERRSASDDRPGRKSLWRDFSFPVLATLMFGIAAALRKAGLPLLPNLSVAMSAAALGTLLALVLWHPFLPRKDRFTIDRKSFKFLLLGGSCLTLAHFAFFAALQRGPLSMVAPLVYTTPLFTMGFSWLVIREMEKLNVRVLAGALLICAGAVFVTLSRG